MLRTHLENAAPMTRQHHEQGLLAVAELRRMGHIPTAKVLLSIVTRDRLAFGHLWLSHGRKA
jgi:hypothetical protein